MSITVPAGWASPLTSKWPLLGSRAESQSWYLVMASPSASVTENRLDKAVVTPRAMLLLEVTTAGALFGNGETVKGDQMLQLLPSEAWISSVSPTKPVTKDVCASCAA